MSYRRGDVVERALVVLDERGLDGLSMRRLAADLGVQPGALYHHVASRDALLALVADELLARGRRASEVVTWDAELRLAAAELRAAMLACRDGAALVARVHALGLGARGPEQRMADALRRAGAEDDLARVGARSVMHYVFGHTADEQLQRAEARPAEGRPDGAPAEPSSGDFHLGLTLLLDGLAARLP
ncbi:TetR family transcriptional regulator [Nocardioides sp.]|uniref:TetR family transcriptional regulator n=1 Tax=Nocardioides sp. TaxID=35761 RepID=UPI0035159AF9